jgi:hypothetical protein
VLKDKEYLGSFRSCSFTLWVKLDGNKTRVPGVVGNLWIIPDEGDKWE